MNKPIYNITETELQKIYQIETGKKYSENHGMPYMNWKSYWKDILGKISTLIN